MKLIVPLLIIISITMAFLSNAFWVWLGIAFAIALIYYGSTAKVIKKKATTPVVMQPPPVAKAMDLDTYKLIMDSCMVTDLPTIDVLSPNKIKYSSNTYINKVVTDILSFYEKNNIVLEHDSTARGIRLDTIRFSLIGKVDGKPALAKDIVRLKADLARTLGLMEGDVTFTLTATGEKTVGITIPSGKNNNIRLRNILEDIKFKSFIKEMEVEKNGKCYINDLPILLGSSTNGNLYYSGMNNVHALVTGSTGSGKSVALNSLIVSLLMLMSDDNLELILIDLKDGIELSPFEKVKHCTSFCDEVPQAVELLVGLEAEMRRRNKLVKDKGFRSIMEYNASPKTKDFIPFIVVIIDEFVSLNVSEEATESLVQLTAKARAAGIWIALTIQQPRANSLDTRIRSNLNLKVTFRVVDRNESQLAIDVGGAENLRGKGDGYVRSAGSGVKRFQGVFTGDSEMKRVLRFWKK